MPPVGCPDEQQAMAGQCQPQQEYYSKYKPALPSEPQALQGRSVACKPYTNEFLSMLVIMPCTYTDT